MISSRLRAWFSTLCSQGCGMKLKWSYFVGQSEGKVKVDFDWL